MTDTQGHSRRTESGTDAYRMGTHRVVIARLHAAASCGGAHELVLLALSLAAAHRMWPTTTPAHTHRGSGSPPAWRCVMTWSRWAGMMPCASMCTGTSSHLQSSDVAQLVRWRCGVRQAMATTAS
jgi:hypothetical protein